MLLLRLASKPLFSADTSIFLCLICMCNATKSALRTGPRSRQRVRRTSTSNVSLSRKRRKSGSPTSIGCATILFKAVCNPTRRFSTKSELKRPARVEKSDSACRSQIHRGTAYRLRASRACPGRSRQGCSASKPHRAIQSGCTGEGLKSRTCGRKARLSGTRFIRTRQLGQQLAAHWH